MTDGSARRVFVLYADIFVGTFSRNVCGPRHKKLFTPGSMARHACSFERNENRIIVMLCYVVKNARNMNNSQYGILVACDGR